jgi:hypothetical protein
MRGAVVSSFGVVRYCELVGLWMRISSQSTKTSGEAVQSRGTVSVVLSGERDVPVYKEDREILERQRLENI